MTGEKDLPKAFRVQPDGSIDFPYIDRLAVAGLEPQEIEEAIKKALLDKKILTDTQVLHFGLAGSYRAIDPNGQPRLSLRGTVQAMPGAFEAACARSQACASAESESAWTRIGELAQRLREHEISGRVPGPAGKLVSVSMNVVFA